MGSGTDVSWGLMMKYRTPLSNALGLGSAGTGVSHWWWQRLTALALIPLVLWFCFSVAMLGATDHTTLTAWISSPLVTVLLIVSIPALLYHLALGMQVIVEDYVHIEWLKLTTIITINFGCFLLAVVGIVAVLEITFGTS